MFSIWRSTLANDKCCSDFFVKTHTLALLNKLNIGRQSALWKWRLPRHVGRTHARTHAVCACVAITPAPTLPSLRASSITSLPWLFSWCNPLIHLVILLDKLVNALLALCSLLKMSLFSIRVEGVALLLITAQELHYAEPSGCLCRMSCGPALVRFLSALCHLCCAFHLQPR